MSFPTLKITRAVVDGDLSLDLPFNPGLNVVYAEPAGTDPRASNKAGKTALVELIQHGLGKRHKSTQRFHFAPIMDQLDRLWLQLEANGQVITIERSLRELGARAAVREHAYSRVIASTPADWIDIEDLSTLYLSKLGMPEVPVPGSQGRVEALSFPNLMRAFVLHQNDSFGEVLDKIPSIDRRRDILGYLSRIKPVSAFLRDAELVRLENRVEAFETRSNAVLGFLRDSGIPDLQEAQQQVANAQERLSKVTEIRRALQDDLRAGSMANDSQSGHLNDLRSELISVGTGRSNAEHEHLGRMQEASRLENLLASLKTDLRKAKRTQSSSTILSSVEFSMCPRCLLEITPEMRQREEYSRCSLCNRPLRTNSDQPPRLVPRAEDIAIQIAEAEEVLVAVRDETDNLSRQIAELHRREQELGRLIEEESRVFVSPGMDKLLAVTRAVSDAEVALAAAQSGVRQREGANLILRELDDARRELAEFQESRAGERQMPIKNRNRWRSLYREVLEGVEFPDLRNASIEGETLMPLINGQLYIHVGTALTSLAVTCFHLALLQLSLEAETFYPRLLVIDSPARDLNDRNHDDLLDYLAAFHARAEAECNESGAAEIPWQIILTTRRITPALRPYTVMTISGKPGRMLLRPTKGSGRRRGARGDSTPAD